MGSPLPPAAPAAAQGEPVPDVPVIFPEGDVQAYMGTSIYSSQLNWPRYNPDELVSWKGPTIYDRMMVDEQVNAVMKFKRDALLSREWALSFDEESSLSTDEQQSRISILTRMLGNIKGSFTDAVACILKAMRYGYSITEKIFEQQLIDNVAYYGISELRPRPPFTFYFKCDPYGTLIEFGQNFGGQLRPLDIRKFVHYVQDPDEDPWFGRSVLRCAYRSWYAKDVLIKMQNLWAERIAGGFLVVTKEVNAPPVQRSELLAIQNAVANIKTISGMAMPPGYKVELISPPATEAFSKMIPYYDLGIAKSLLVPDLFGITNKGETGAYAQSQTQLTTFFWTINADSARLESSIQDQIIFDLCEVNWGDGEYPRFGYKPASEEFVKWVIGQWSALITGNAVITTEADESHLRRILNMPQRSDKDKPLAQTKAEQAAKQPVPPGGAGSGAGTTGSLAPGGSSGRSDIGTGDAGNADFKHGKPRQCTIAQFSKALQRVNFAVIDQRTEAMTIDTTRVMSPLIAKATWNVLKNTAEYLKEPASISDARFTTTDIGKLNRAAQAGLMRSWQLGGRMASNEMLRAKAPKLTRASFAALRADAAAEYLQANAFRMAGNLTDGARAIIQQELLNGVKSGGRPEEVAMQIYQRLIAKGFTSLQAAQEAVDDRDVVDALNQSLGTTGEAGTLAYLNTLTRTNMFEAMNEARFSAFTDPDLDGFVQALEYSAILDDRTTEICQALDGSTWSSGSDEWDTYRPPNHYNCRSVLVPITLQDGWDGEESPDPGVVPQDGFGAGDK